MKQIIREPAVAGRFYPEEETELLGTIQHLFAESSANGKDEHDEKKDANALIVPHAGYIFSGIVAASAYKCLPKNPPKNVFLIGTSHYSRMGGVSVFSGHAYRTPLGVVPVATEITNQLLLSTDFSDVPMAHENEHSLEVQLPFLQYLWQDNFQIIPLLVGTESTKKLDVIAKSLQPYVSSENLFIVSTDLSHYPDYENANFIDKKTIDVLTCGDKAQLKEHLLTIETAGIKNLVTGMCGWSSVYILLSLFENFNHVSYQPICYQNSGDIAQYGDKKRVVGYQSVAVKTDFVSEIQFAQLEQKTLINLSHHAVEFFLETRKKEIITPKNITGLLNNKLGAFVSVYVKEELRGCIGNFFSTKPLYELIQELSVQASFYDNRFPELKDEEYNEVSFEISVLTPIKRINAIDEFEPKKHGIYIKKGQKTGTYLPQVAAKTGWNRREMLEHCSEDKAGLGKDGWKDAELYTYSAIIINEK